MRTKEDVVKSVVVERYGPPEVAKVVETPEPAIQAGEMLVRIEAVAVSAGDARMRAGRFPRGMTLPGKLVLGIRGPRNPVLGTAFSGVIERVGSEVEGFSPGDEIAGMNGAKLSAHAQFAAIRPKAVAHKPAGVSNVDAAGSIFGGATALHFLEGRVKPGDKVLINGASGSVGSAAVQLAALAGAEVTAVTSAANVELVERLGAKQVIDYRTQSLDHLPGGYDLVFDTVGNIDRQLGLKLAASDGAVILAAADLLDTIRARGRVIAGPASESSRLITQVLSLVETGSFDPLATSLGGFDSIVEAYRLVDSGRKVGNAVVEPWA